MKTRFLASLATLLLLGPLQAHAVVITVSGHGAADGVWEVTTIQGTFLDVEDQLTAQVWTPSLDLAFVFAELVRDSLGMPNFSLPVGPLFASIFFGSGTNAAISAAAWFPPTPGFPTASGGTVGWIASSPGTPVWAVATRAVPEPATAGLFALALAGAMAGRRRHALR